MADWTGLRNWFGGGTRDRELDETRARWHAVEARWQASAFPEGLSKLAVSWVREVGERGRERPALPILVEFAVMTEAILASEGMGAIEPLWGSIDSDVEVALNFRKVLRRRERYVGDAAMLGYVHDRLEEAYCALLRAMPASCFREWPESEGALGVPLIDLLDDPASVIEALLLSPTSDETLQFELLERLRVHLVNNMVEASGFPRQSDINQVGSKLRLPTDLKGMSPPDLAEAYLGGTPFLAILETPVPFVIPEHVRFEHAHIVGGTGHGKTQLLQRLIHTDLVAAQQDGRSVVVIDSQGDLINKLVRLELFNPERPGALPTALSSSIRPTLRLLRASISSTRTWTA